MRKLDVRLPRLSDIQIALMLFAQALSTQILVYPLAFLSVARNTTKTLPRRAVVVGCMVLGYAALSVLLRGGSVALLVKLMQFYFGIAIFVLAFMVDRSLRVGVAMIWLFVALVLYEIASSNILGVEPFMYLNSDLAGVGAAARANLGFGLSRAYGPALNSSVSGSILAVMFFFLSSRSCDLAGFSIKRKLLAVSVFLAFVLCGSATSYMVFIFLLICSFVRRIDRVRSGGVNRRYISQLSPGPLAVVGAAVGLALGVFLLSDFLDAVIEAKMNSGYFEFIWNLKLEQASQALSFSTLLFGVDLTGVLPGNTGGDFILLDALVKMGLLGMLGLFALLYGVCPKENRLYLMAGWLSSLHYGTIFSLCGQVFFGALCANSLLLMGPGDMSPRLPEPAPQMK